MSEKKSCACACGGAPKLIFACSGGADVGELADQAARTMTRNGQGKMFCLAGIGGRVSECQRRGADREHHAKGCQHGNTVRHGDERASR